MAPVVEALAAQQPFWTPAPSTATTARRTGTRTEDVLEFEAARVVPARDRFAGYVRALGFEA